MAITKIQSGAIPADAIDTTHIGDVGADKITGQVVSSQISDLNVTHAKLHTDMDLSSKTVALPTLSTLNITGNVGIGTSSPARLLHLEGNDGPSGTTSGNSDTQLFIDNNGNNGSILEFGASNDSQSWIMFSDEDTANQGRIQYAHSNDTMYFSTAQDRRMSLSASEVVFNDDSRDQDFRVESNGISNMILVDAGEDVVKIGTSGGVQTAGNGDARLIVGNGIEIIQDLAANSLNKDMLRLSTAGSWSISGNNGYYSDITWDNGGTNTMGRIGLRFGSTTTGGQSEFTIRDMYQGGFGNSGNIAHFGSNKSVILEGSLKVGKTSADDTIGGINFEASTNAEAFAFTHTHASNNSGWSMLVNRQSSVGDAIRFRQANGDRGSIYVSTSGTTYNTTSDRRLKDNIVTIADGKEKLLAMNPVTHTWKADPNGDAVHGFIAQEMQEVVPEAVSGEPDGDDMMSMDYGRITPVIVAALQDALNEIKELKTRIDELENK